MVGGYVNWYEFLINKCKIFLEFLFLRMYFIISLKKEIVFENIYYSVILKVKN